MPLVYDGDAALRERLRREARAAVTIIARSSRWWEFHQGVAALVYGVMTWPAWIARGTIGGKEGNAICVAILAAAIIAATLRRHLWFTSRFYPAELAWARLPAAAWVFAADWVFTGTLVISGVLIGELRPRPRRRADRGRYRLRRRVFADRARHGTRRVPPQYQGVVFSHP